MHYNGSRKIKYRENHFLDESNRDTKTNNKIQTRTEQNKNKTPTNSAQRAQKREWRKAKWLRLKQY